MNKYNSSSLIFNSIYGKKVQAHFDGGQVTSDAGILLLRETERHEGLITRFTRCIHDTRNPFYIRHKLKELLTQRVFQIAAGYEDGNDCNELRSDPSLKLAAGRLPLSGKDLASQPTISRFENSIRRSDLLRIGYAMVDHFAASYRKPPSLIVLDFDDTDDETHGMQQLSLFNPYYDSHCYLPLHVYEGISGKLIASILRPGKRLTGQQTVAILKRIVKRIRSSWPDTIILFRGDSHFCSHQILQWCEENNILYCVGYPGTTAIKRLAEPLMAEAKSLFASSKISVTLYETFSYTARNWKSPRQVVVKVEVNEGKTNRRFLVHNLTEPGPAVIYRTIYSGRGQMENYIKDHKLGLKSDRTSCHNFIANQFRLFLHSAAYILMHSLKNNTLKGTQWAKAQFDTIRLKLFKIGARVQEMKTKIKFHLPSSFPYKSVLFKICAVFSVIRVT